MKICLVSQDFYPDNIGGQGIYAFQLANKLAKRGHEVCVLTCYSQKREKFLRKLNFNTLFISNHPFQNPLTFGVLAFLIFKRKLKMEKFDVLHSSELCGFLFNCLKPKNISKFISASHNSYWDRWQNTKSFLGKLKYRMIMPLEKSTFSRADRIVIGSEIEEKAMEAYKIPNSKVKLIYYGVGFDFKIKDKKKAADLKKKYKIPKEGKVILYVARMVERKKPHILFEAAKKAIRRRKDLYFLLVGDGPYLKRLKRLKYDKQRIIFTGKISYEKLPPFYFLSDIFVLPSVGEGSISLTVLEAASVGLPLILTSDSAGNCPIFKNGYNGFLTKVDDVEDLCEKILKVLPFVKKMGRRSHSLAEKYFTWNYHAKSLETIYRELFNTKVS